MNRRKCDKFQIIEKILIQKTCKIGRVSANINKCCEITSILLRIWTYEAPTRPVKAASARRMRIGHGYLIDKRSTLCRMQWTRPDTTQIVDTRWILLNAQDAEENGEDEWVRKKTVNEVLMKGRRRWNVLNFFLKREIDMTCVVPTAFPLFISRVTRQSHRACFGACH